jgi:hypothetical protein
MVSHFILPKKNQNIEIRKFFYLWMIEFIWILGIQNFIISNPDNYFYDDLLFLSIYKILFKHHIKKKNFFNLKLIKNNY